MYLVQGRSHHKHRPYQRVKEWLGSIPINHQPPSFFPALSRLPFHLFLSKTGDHRTDGPTVSCTEEDLIRTVLSTLRTPIQIVIQRVRSDFEDRGILPVTSSSTSSTGSKLVRKGISRQRFQPR